MHRHHTLSIYAVSAVAAALFYVVPFAVMALCIHLGWYAR